MNRNNVRAFGRKCLYNYVRLFFYVKLCCFFFCLLAKLFVLTDSYLRTYLLIIMYKHLRHIGNIFEPYFGR